MREPDAASSPSADRVSTMRSGRVVSAGLCVAALGACAVVPLRPFDVMMGPLSKCGVAEGSPRQVLGWMRGPLSQ